MTIPDYDEKTHCSHCGSKLQLSSEEQHNTYAVLSSEFRRDLRTIGELDQWLILALRMLNFMDREDVADGLEEEFNKLKDRIKHHESRI